MNAHLHTMSNLFEQLGLPADSASIDNFIAAHRPIGTDLRAQPLRRDQRLRAGGGRAGLRDAGP